MAVRYWRAAFSIVLSLNAAHAIANAAENNGAYLAEYCSGARGLREVAQDETKISSELCQSRSGDLKKGRERFHRFASVIPLNHSADADLMQTRMAIRTRVRQRDETSRHSDLKPVTSTIGFSVSQRINH